MGLKNRLARLEEKSSRGSLAPHWTQEEVVRRVVDEMDFAVTTNSPLRLCTEELEAVGVSSMSELPDSLQPYIVLHPAGASRRRYEDSPEEFESWRDRTRRHDERIRSQLAESKQRDRELLEKNRASCGLPPLTSEQIKKWGLEGTAMQ